MTNEERYMKIRENIQAKVNEGVLTEEAANEVNKMAMEKYMTITESKKDEVAELLDTLKDGVENGSVSIPKEVVDQLKGLVPAEGSDDSSDDAGEGEEGGEEAKEEGCSKESCKKESCTEEEVKEAVRVIDEFLDSLISE